jgi:hypothetical protein
MIGAVVTTLWVRRRIHFARLHAKVGDRDRHVKLALHEDDGRRAFDIQAGHAALFSLIFAREELHFIADANAREAAVPVRRVLRRQVRKEWINIFARSVHDRSGRVALVDSDDRAGLAGEIARDDFRVHADANAVRAALGRVEIGHRHRVVVRVLVVRVDGVVLILIGLGFDSGDGRGRRLVSASVVRAGEREARGEHQE